MSESFDPALLSQALHDPDAADVLADLLLTKGDVKNADDLRRWAQQTRDTKGVAWTGWGGIDVDILDAPPGTMPRFQETLVVEGIAYRIDAVGHSDEHGDPVWVALDRPCEGEPVRIQYPSGRCYRWFLLPRLLRRLAPEPMPNYWTGEILTEIDVVEEVP